MNLSGRAVLLTVISVCNRGMAQLPIAERTLVRRLCERVFGVNLCFQISPRPALIEFLRTGV